MKNKRVLVWFRQDLRIHDNTALLEAIKAGDEVYPVYVFDERTFLGTTKYGFRKTGIIRTSFIIDSVTDLRKNLQKLGAELIVRIGNPEDVVFSLAKELKTSWVFCNRERTQEEVTVQDALEKNLWTIGQELRFSRGKMLYFTADLPFPITHIPNTFAQFRKEIERIVPVRKPMAAPSRIHQSARIAPMPGKMPVLSDFGMVNTSRIKFLYKGGESVALRKLSDFSRSWTKESNRFKEGKFLYKESSLTFFSAYLAQGCLSPKRIYAVIEKYIHKPPSDSEMSALFLRLMKRDFMRFMAKKYGNLIFNEEGTSQISREDLKIDLDLFRNWHEGETGIPIVDASMRQLNETGYISNLSRRIAADYLVNHFHIDWRLGAEYYESTLVDYDPCSNWVNWNYIAGVAASQGDLRNPSYIALAKKYDPKGEYVKTWIPELKNVPVKYIHKPHFMPVGKLQKIGIVLGKEYPEPVLTAKYPQPESDSGHSTGPIRGYASQSQNFD